MKHLLLTTIAAVLLATTAFADPIHDAAWDGNLAGVQAELDKGVDVNAKTDDGWERTPLHLATWTGHKRVAELLIDKGAFLDAKDKEGWTPLHMAALNVRKEIVELLFDKGAFLDAKDRWGRTPLHIATNEGHKEVVELLVTKGADVNAKEEDGWTPLFRAVGQGHKEMVELLIAKGADVDAKGDDGRTPLDWAVDLGYTEITDLLRKHAGKTSEELFALFKAAAKGNIEAVKQHLDGGADVNAKDGGGWTPLHFAAWFGHTEVAELLIAKGADVNAKDHTGRTPLNEAIETNQTKTADLLRTHGGKTGIEHVEDRLNSLNETLSQLQHLIIGDDGGGDPDEPSIEKLQGVFVIRGKIGGIYEVQYHTGDNDWQVREAVTLQANRQLYIDSSSYDEKRFYRVKLQEE
jgi:ankyrin repeat protein